MRPGTAALAWRITRSALCAMANIAFARTPRQGALVWLAILCFSPWGALGAALGAASAAVFGRALGQTEEEISSGTGGYDAALVGLFWGGVLARDAAPALLFPLAIAATLALRRPVLASFSRLGLPPLGVTALLGGWLCDLTFRALGNWFWVAPPQPPFGVAGIALGICALAWALLEVEARAAFLAAAAALAVFLLDRTLALGTVEFPAEGLWGFTVAPAAFGISAAFLPGLRRGYAAGIMAALLGALVWLAWVRSGLAVVLPPLMAPLFAGIWLTLAWWLRSEAADALRPEVAAVAAAIAGEERKGRTIIALTGAGISTESGIPDYSSGAWCDPAAPLSAYTFGAFLADAECRRFYWASCAVFRTIAEGARPNAGHQALSSLESSGWLQAVVTQNVDGLHQASQSRNVVDLHGSIDRIGCLACGWSGAWPKGEPWNSRQLSCRSCGGWLKPSVIALGETLVPATWQQALAMASRTGLLLVCGTQLAISSASALVSAARSNGARAVFITLGPVGVPILPGDLVVSLPCGRALRAIECLLNRPLLRPGRRARLALEANAAMRRGGDPGSSAIRPRSRRA